MRSIKSRAEIEWKIHLLESEIDSFERNLRTSFLDTNPQNKHIVAHRITTQCNELKREVYLLLEEKTFDLVINMKIENIYSRAAMYILRYETLIEKGIPLSWDLLAIDHTSFWNNLERKARNQN